MDLNQSNSEESNSNSNLSNDMDVEADVMAAFEEVKSSKEEASDEPESNAEVVEVSQVESDDSEEGEEDTETKDDSPIDPPADWKAEEKEFFKTLPREVQEPLARRAAETRSEIGRALSEVAEIKKQYSSIDNVIEPIRNEILKSGQSEADYIQSVINGDILMSRDIVSAFDYFAKRNGTTVSQIAEALESAGSSYDEPEYQQAPDIQSLVDERVQQYMQPLYQQHTQTAQQAELAEIHSVRDEAVDGRYLRPEMHDEKFVIEELGPTYQALRQVHPNKSPSEVMRMAYTSCTGKAPQASKALTTKNRKNASSASLSIKGSAAKAPVLKPEDVPDNVEATVMQVAREMGYDI